MTTLAPPAPHPFVKPIATGVELEGRTCWVCGHGWNGSRGFVEARIQSNDPVIPAGLMHTSMDEPGRTVIRHRDPATGEAQALTQILNPLICTDCIRAMAQQAGMPPAAIELQNELSELRERAEAAERERDEVRDENAQIRHAAGVAQALTTLFDVEKREQRAFIDSVVKKTTRTQAKKGDAR